MGDIAVPGASWEVEFCADEQVDVEIFRSNDTGVVGEEALVELFAQHSD